MENDDLYPGTDLMVGTEDDGRSLMIAYETIPFRIEGLEPEPNFLLLGIIFLFCPTFKSLESCPKFEGRQSF